MGPTSRNATVVHSTPKAVPLLTEGHLTPGVVTDWENACFHYFIERDIADEKRVVKVAGGLQDPLIRAWFLTNHKTLAEMSWKDFTALLRKKWLPRDWARGLKNQIFTSKMKTSDTWRDWTVEVEKMNIALMDTPSHFDEKALRALFEANACDDLVLRINEHSAILDEVDDYDDWKDAVNTLDEMRAREDAKILRAVRAARRPQGAQALPDDIRSPCTGRLACTIPP